MFHILVVEDNPNARKLMEAVLKQNGYEPLLAADGVEALEVLDNKHVDLIVLDVMMPRMDGYEFTETLRSSGCELPILMVTAKEKPADKRKGFIIGTDDYMVKPVDEEEMIFTRRQLMDEIWDMDTETDERTVDVHINRLRDRFRNNPDFDIVTVRGLGYKAVKRA